MTTCSVAIVSGSASRAAISAIARVVRTHFLGPAHERRDDQRRRRRGRSEPRQRREQRVVRGSRPRGRRRRHPQRAGRSRKPEPKKASRSSRPRTEQSSSGSEAPAAAGPRNGDHRWRADRPGIIGRGAARPVSEKGWISGAGSSDVRGVASGPPIAMAAAARPRGSVGPWVAVVGGRGLLLDEVESFLDGQEGPPRPGPWLRSVRPYSPHTDASSTRFEVTRRHSTVSPSLTQPDIARNVNQNTVYSWRDGMGTTPHQDRRTSLTTCSP